MGYIKKLGITGFKRFREFEMQFNSGMNIIVGENESGKSTILEAINIVLNQTYRNHDKYIIRDMLNLQLIDEFKESPSVESLPEIKIVLTLELDDIPGSGEFFGEDYFQGKDNAEFGISFECKLDDEYIDLVAGQIDQGEIPYEYYLFTWKTFQGTPYKIMKKPLQSILIDTSTCDTNNSFNYYNRTLFKAKYTDEDQMRAKNEFRKHMDSVFSELRLGKLDENREFKVNSKKTILESIISIYDENIPLENKGSGMENLIKTQIALDKRKSKIHVVMIEEPENHLCHTNLMQMIASIEEKNEESQLILTTHNNTIASRLNLNNIKWISNEQCHGLGHVKTDTAKFFEKSDNNSLLQLLLSKKAFLVEGATEYLLLPGFYEKITDSGIEKDEITIISCNGISYKHYLEIAEKADKKVAVITDNDVKQTNIKYMNDYNDKHPDQHIFMCKDLEGWTWEACLYNNNKDLLEKKIDVKENFDYKFHGKNYEKVLGKMLNNKVETAYQMLSYISDLSWPDYIEEAVKWLRK